MEQDIYNAAAQQCIDKALRGAPYAMPCFVLAVFFGVWSWYFFHLEAHCDWSKSYIGRALLTALLCLFFGIGAVITHSNYIEARDNPELYVVKELAPKPRTHPMPVPVYIHGGRR